MATRNKKPEATEASPAIKKTVCPLTREQFEGAAGSIPIVIGDQRLTANPKVFSTGSFGFYAGGKVDLMVGDKSVTFQVGINVIAVGSNPNPK